MLRELPFIGFTDEDWIVFFTIQNVIYTVELTRKNRKQNKQNRADENNQPKTT
jgi:uncharacterized membrane protein YkvA (DUF1232 family)